MSWWVSQWGSSSVHVVVTDPWIMVWPVTLTCRTGELERLSGARSQLKALGLLKGAAATAVTARTGISGLLLGVASDTRHLLSSVTYHITSSRHAMTGSVCHPNHILTPDPQVMVSGSRALGVMKLWRWSPVCDECSHEGDPRESPSSPRWGHSEGSIYEAGSGLNRYGICGCLDPGFQLLEPRGLRACGWWAPFCSVRAPWTG